MPKLPAEYSRTNLSSDPIYRYLRITKGGPGGVPGRSAEQDLVDSAWLQRLRRNHQLQSAGWVFATADHSRFQHALGAMHLAGGGARRVPPSLAGWCSGTPSVALVEETMRMAGLLHDVGHGPFGHFFDENYLDTWGIDHEVIGRALITGPLADMVAGLGASPNADFQPREHIDPRWVAYLIAGPDLAGFVAPPWLAALKPALVGAYSADNMDYVPRDSYICGVAAGPVDVQRILHYSFISERGLTLHAHAADLTGASLSVTREQFAGMLREKLPPKLSKIEFEVDVAAQESRAFNPISETADILLYDPLEDRYQQSRVLDLFRRLPVRMTLFRIFARDAAHSRELVKAASEVLGSASG